MNKKTVRDIDLKDKKVLVRCDFNVPFDDNGNISDNRRIVSALPTIKYLLENNCKVILCSHLGRPKGEYNMDYTLEPIAKELSKLLGIEVKLSADVIGDSAKELTSSMKNGEIVLLENVRFEAGEEKNDEELSKALASMADVYVNDAFGTAHRAHSSTTGVASFLPAVSGFLIEKELECLGDAVNNPVRPFVAILGGKKVSDKIGVIENLLDKVDTLILGGGMAYTFLKSMGHSVGNSVCELDKLDLAQELLKKAEEKNVKVILPVDNVIAQEIRPDVVPEILHSNDIPDGWMGLDIGPKTAGICTLELENAKTVIWNGPVGLSEYDIFADGTKIIANCLANLKDCKTIIGGGDSAAAIEKMGLAKYMTHISTGGGASLEYLEGKELPGIEALMNK